MARRARIDIAGFYHIVNRGVAQSDVYLSDEDKEKFLQIVCKACRIYRVDLHDYCLMDNHYHLLVKTASNNLSLFMRQINSNYAIYFNKKYNRVGHLWQGRFKSYYVFDETYLHRLFRYIEHNPIEAGVCNRAGEYPFTLLATVIRDDLEVVACAKNSELVQKIDYEGFREYLQLALSQEELEEIKEFRSKEIVQKENGIVYKKAKPLKAFFEHIENKEQRDKAVLKALDAGYKQADIARFLSLSASAIAKIRKKYE